MTAPQPGDEEKEQRQHQPRVSKLSRASAEQLATSHDATLFQSVDPMDSLDDIQDDDMPTLVDGTVRVRSVRRPMRRQSIEACPFVVDPVTGPQDDDDDDGPPPLEDIDVPPPLDDVDGPPPLEPLDDPYGDDDSPPPLADVDDGMPPLDDMPQQQGFQDDCTWLDHCSERHIHSLCVTQTVTTKMRKTLQTCCSSTRLPQRL